MTERPGAQSDDDTILAHYRGQAEQHGLAPTSTMADQTTRQLEIDAITACVDHALAAGTGRRRLLEVGCGNGFLLAALAERFPDLTLVGTDYSPDMVELAAKRDVPGCTVRREDARALGFADGEFDIVVTERCLINLLDPEEQAQGLRELHRVVAPGGHLVLVEAFVDGAANLNRARTELGLDETAVPFHNRWFDPVVVDRVLDGLVDPVEGGDLPPRNFLSSHYFVSRVLYPAVTRAPIIYNAELVQFFRFLPPIGNYAPIQLLFLRRRHA